MSFLIEYDDGKHPELKDEDKDPRITRRGRRRGFYFDNQRIPIGYMRISEMNAMADFLLSVAH